MRGRETYHHAKDMNKLAISGNPMFVRREQLAQTLNVSPRTLSNWTKSGAIPFVKVGGAVLFSPVDVAEALQRFRHAAVGEMPAKKAGGQ
jgi:excisionase family DNA binding protein